MGKFTASMCKSFIFILNTLLAIVALGLMAVSIYVLVEFYDQKIVSEAGYSAIGWVPLGISIILLIMAIVGCCSTAAEKKCCLGFFGALQFIFGIIIIVAGSALLTGNSAAKSNALLGEPNQIEDSTWGLNRAINDVTVAAYKVVCDTTINPSECKADVSAPTCYWEIDTYSAIVKALEDSTDAQNALKNAVPCGGSYNQFQFNFAEYTESYWMPAGIAITIFGSFVFICFLGSMYLCCCYKKGKGNNEQTAQQMSGMNPPQYASKV